MSKTSFLWDPVEDNIVKELDGGDATVAEFVTEPDHFGNVISQHRSGQSSFFHYDGQGSALAVTHDNQVVTDSRAYSAFGEMAENTGSTSFPFQYIGESGYLRDSVAGEYLVRQRPLSSQRGRWLTAAPLPEGRLLDANRLSLRIEFYCYVLNSPTGLTEPSGLTNRAPQPRTPAPRDQFPDPDDGRCTLAFDCTKIPLHGIEVGTHCGLAMKWWRAGRLVTRSYHAFGLYRPGEGCRIETVSTGSKYDLYNIGDYPASTCECIRSAVTPYNEGIKKVRAVYSISPKNSCAGQECNSNYATKCVLRACGLDLKAPRVPHSWGGATWIPGWKLRIHTCVKASPRTHCRCVCEQWERSDDDWCGGPPGEKKQPQNEVD